MHTVARRVKQQRWQPYTQSAPVPPAPAPTYLATPASSTASNSPPPSLLDRKPSPKSLAGIALIERAVNCLDEIWPGHQAESLFATMPYIPSQHSGSQMGSTPLVTPSKAQPSLTNQLPSPVSPQTRVQQSAILDQIAASQANSIPSNPIMPIRSYVHELLRRSRTSLAVLQTALCYVEAAGIQVASIRANHTVPFADTPRSSVTISEDHIPASIPTLAPATASAPIAPLPLAPHPLLCARRTFLASLLLAHKFTADKAFSNKAWARLTNMSPREVGRCERALGEALEWRLWVGKPTPAPVEEKRLGRSHSAPATYFETPDVRMDGAVYVLPSQANLGRAATEPSMGMVHMQHHRPLTYSPAPIADDVAYAGSGQPTLRVEDEDDVDSRAPFGILRGWNPPFINSTIGPSSGSSTPALSPASSVLSTSSGSESGSEMGASLVPASWIPMPSSMRKSFTMEYDSQSIPMTGIWAVP